ncbi:hypothetical protein [Rossellomorea aquimaris]|uniref:hypothetical protein n=1 Tax=Rossellomorea aquimaris TaxID=189382 RepID=UPI0016537804|nr:hypothetical protein [Rossellomorea aquimaris]
MLADGTGFACGVSPVIKSGSALVRPDRQMFSREKKALFPFILLRLFDPEGLGAGTRRPLFPQEIVRLPLQSSYVKGDESKIEFYFFQKRL